MLIKIVNRIDLRSAARLLPRLQKFRRRLSPAMDMEFFVNVFNMFTHSIRGGLNL